MVTLSQLKGLRGIRPLRIQGYGSAPSFNGQVDKAKEGYIGDPNPDPAFGFYHHVAILKDKLERRYLDRMQVN